MSKVFNLTELVDEANEIVDRDDLYIPIHGDVHDVEIKFVEPTEENYFKLPEWWCIMEDKDAEVSFGFRIQFTGMDFVNKLTINNLKVLGVTDFSDINVDVVAAQLLGQKVTVKVKWGKNKKDPAWPYQNHTLVAEVLDIPAMDEDEDF
jgi:hypothetical protein